MVSTIVRIELKRTMYFMLVFDLQSLQEYMHKEELEV
jgi:hypothetical protein